MKFLTRYLLAGLSLTFLFSPLSLMAEEAKPLTAKQRLVLMPLRTSEDIQKMQGAMESALIEGLGERYEVFAGERVRQKSKEIFSRESSVANEANRKCDGTRCMQDIAASFQAELVAVATVNKAEDGYLLTLNITNIFDEKTVYSKSSPCKNCGNFQVIVKLKELTGMTVKEESEHLNWAIGINNTASKGGAYALYGEYDGSNLTNLPVRLRLGYYQFKTDTKTPSTVNADGCTAPVPSCILPYATTITDKENISLPYLTANYYFGPESWHLHPFVGAGLGLLKIETSCTNLFNIGIINGAAGGACTAQAPTNKAIGIAIVGVEYDIVKSFGIQANYHSYAGANLGLFFKF